jgi:hypothetical protein
VEAEFHRKAKGPLRAVCDPGPDLLAQLDLVTRDGKAEAWIPVHLVDPSGEVVTDARFLAAVKRFER